MVLSKFDVAIVVAVATGMLWIEHGHRISIVTPMVAETPAETPAASACPDNDSVPFSADCIAFIDGGVPPIAHTRMSVVISAPTASPDAPCPPNNENSPYSARCIKFLSGWYWQPNPADRAP
jgi:hypothetical protein